MDEKNRLTDDQLKEMSGGESAGDPEQKFNIGDVVFYHGHPEYDSGTVNHVYQVEENGKISYKYMVLFKIGVIAANEYNLYKIQ